MVNKLKVYFQEAGATVKALDSVSFSISGGDKTAVLGETGCGKSVMALAIFRLLPQGAVIKGEAFFDGIDLLSLPVHMVHELRGRDMVLIPQNPLSHLNPVLSIGVQVAEAVRRVGLSGAGEVRDKTLELLSAVGLPEPQSLIKTYPHQLSGGMAQRVLLAIGLAARPRLVIADEPTKGLDTSTRDMYLETIKNLYPDSALLTITHDLEVAATCDQIMVMYAGEIVESGSRDRVLGHPLHPYTAGLLNAHPDHGMKPVPGSSPSLSGLPAGCRFQPRCGLAQSICRTEHPKLVPIGDSKVRCFYAGC